MFVIFGATGFIGRALQSALLRRGVKFVGFGSKACVRGDGAAVSPISAVTLEERKPLLQCLPRPNAIIFAAGTAVTGTDPAVLQKSHLDSLIEAFGIVPEAWWDGLPFVYASSAIVYDRPEAAGRILETDRVAPHSHYAAIKLRCESFVADAVASAGARTTLARLFNVSGFGQREGIVAEIAQQAIEIQSGRRSEFRLRNNEPILDLIDVGEAAAALLTLAEPSDRYLVVNICSGRPSTTQDLIAAACRAIGRQAPVRYAVDTDHRQMLVGNPELMHAKTGWRARRSLDEIVAAVISGHRLAGEAA
jgi:nucleoside-diphosphate-sugar epimerase